MKKITGWFSKVSIRNKVQYIFMFFIIITIVLCFIFSFSITRLKLTKTYVEKNDDKINSVYKSYNSVIDNASHISKLIMVNDIVLKYLRDDKSDPSKNIVRDDVVRKELYSIINSFSGRYTVFVLKQCEVPESHIMRTDSHTDDTVRTELKTYYVNTAIGIMRPFDNYLFSDQWYGAASERKGGYLVFSNNQDAFSFNTETKTISFTRIVNDIDDQQPLGLLVVNISVSELEQTYENFIGDESSFAFVDSDGKIICSSMERQQLTSLIKENKKLITQQSYHVTDDNTIISSRKIPDTDMYIICTSKMSFLEDMSFEVLGIILGILVIMLVMIIMTSRYINKYVTLPVTRLSETMQRSANGNIQIDEVSTSDDEIGRLQSCYNDMAIKINKLIEEVIEQEKQRQKAEMTVVQEQMKPHFLYNTLDTIGLMALQNSREEVYDAIETLGTFYRKFLSKGNESITLSDELSIVKSYIKLLRLRYDDMFEDEYDIQEDLNNIMIIKLILQPLVENAIYHGIRPKGEHGIIRISVYSENNRIHIKIYDSGIGMNQEHIDKLIRGEDKKSFGFKGTIDRIRGFYQNDAYVSINSTEGEFCEIDINIPDPR